MGFQPQPSEIRILVVMGVSGSGKSTVGEALAKELGWSFIEGDQFHSRQNVAKMSAGTPLTDGDRSAWLGALKAEMKKVLQDGKGAVVACSALKASYRTKLKIDNRVQFVFLNISFEEAKHRLKERKGHFMPASLLESQFATLEQPEGDESINVDAQQAADQIVKEVVAKLQIQNA
jgi:gluconokinase